LFGRNASGTSVAGNIYSAIAPVASDAYSGIKSGVKDAYNYVTSGSTNNPSGGGGSGAITGTAYDDNGNLNPGWEIVGSNPVFTGNYDTYGPTSGGSYSNSLTQTTEVIDPAYYDEYMGR
jgi:hypothetical protein